MKKRYRIEFTVDTDGWSDESIKDMALQELTCMVPYPEDITFSEVDNPWHTGTPIEEGWYLFRWHDDKERWFTVEYLTSEGIKEKDKWDSFDNSKWQKIEEKDKCQEMKDCNRI